jgi:hypothetical protein
MTKNVNAGEELDLYLHQTIYHDDDTEKIRAVFDFSSDPLDQNDSFLRRDNQNLNGLGGGNKSSSQTQTQDGHLILSSRSVEWTDCNGDTNILLDAVHPSVSVCYTVEATTRGRKSQSSSSFRRFLLEARAKSQVELLEAPPQSETSVGVLKIIVKDVEMWHSHSKKWFENETGSWNSASFFMRLRRLGCRPLNRSPTPGSSGYDFGLARKDVAEHGFQFDYDMWTSYKISSSRRGRRTTVSSVSSK